MTATTATTTTTIGMLLDATLDLLHTMSSAQLYSLIVVLTMIVCAVLLVQSPELPKQQHRRISESNKASVTAWMARQNQPTAAATTTAATGPEPQWYIFRYVNYVVIAIFVGSVADFCLHWSSYWNESDMLLRFLFGWSVLLCYFFGFFGVSFVHDAILVLNGDEEERRAADINTNADAKHQQSTNKATAGRNYSLVDPEKRQSDTKLAPVCCSSDAQSKPITKSNGIPCFEELSDDQIASLVLMNHLKDHELERELDAFRAVRVRRMVMASKLAALGHAGALDALPSEHSLDYDCVHGANCEIVVGYVPIPVGLCGPITINDESVFVPMATTEGCLVASTNRGAKAIALGGGAVAEIVRDGITRAPCLRMQSAREAARLKVWCELPENFATLKAAFESTTSFGKLKSCSPTIAGRNVYLRLCCFSGDAMGMNMVSKGSLAVIECLKEKFPSLQLVALSGNMCTDKKAAATNWIEGRGKSVVVEAIIPKDVVHTTLKTTVQAMVDTNLHKNLIGSAMAGVVGGFNAHASNIVTAIFLATGQDPAQNVESSNCITLLEETDQGDLWISCTMPSIEVGTVGGGTSLAAQAACLKAIGCQGGGSNPGENAQKLAKVVAAATMAGELSLLAALAANTLVAAHMQHNRKTPTK